MLVLFFGLVILCALFFGMGFTMGKNSVRMTPELLATPSGVRPSAANQPAAKTPTAGEQAPAPTAQAPAQTPTGDPNAAQTGSALPAVPPGPGYLVQVAAVSKQEDADSLVEALKGHQYAAFISTQPADKLFHVQVGPFADIKDAEATRAKLVADGYSPILKK